MTRSFLFLLPQWIWRRSFLWAALMVLILIGQSLLVILSIRHEEIKSQEQVEDLSSALLTHIKHEISNEVRNTQSLVWSAHDNSSWRDNAAHLLNQSQLLLQLEHRTHSLELISRLTNESLIPNAKPDPIASRLISIENACSSAKRLQKPFFSSSYFNPEFAEIGIEVIDFCIAHAMPSNQTTFTIGTVGLHQLLSKSVSIDTQKRHEISLLATDGARLARIGMQRGKSVFVGKRSLILDGSNLDLYVDSSAARPSFIPNLSIALVLGLSTALCAVILLLMRDTRERSKVETELAQSLAFRRAMENSLSTGLRARDLTGRITYANPAFCHMVGYSFEALQSHTENGADPPYWPVDRRQDYRTRQAKRHIDMGSDISSFTHLQSNVQGFETEFIRHNGEIFPVMIYESPLLDHQGHHTGWMSSIVDISQQRLMEDQTRQQQERLQSVARLVTVGEMASLLSHELNQPLAAISSYANGSLNLLHEPDEQTLPMIQDALAEVANQADRAGRIIRSVHDFVRRRDKSHELISVGQLMHAVMPLIELQARKIRTRIELHMPIPELKVRVDRILIEQVLINLARNGIQAMEQISTSDSRTLTIDIQPTSESRVQFSVQDTGAGIAPEVAAQLFKPFFTTRTEGMGMGLSLCRTVIEQHGGTLEFASVLPHKGCRFWFTLAIAPNP
jgi:two-component system sensor histidine kinase DctS